MGCCSCCCCCCCNSALSPLSSCNSDDAVVSDDAANTQATIFSAQRKPASRNSALTCFRNLCYTYTLHTYTCMYIYSAVSTNRNDFHRVNSHSAAYSLLWLAINVIQKFLDCYNINVYTAAVATLHKDRDQSELYEMLFT
jgi:hypothetical protein